MLWSQGRKKGSEVLTQWKNMCLACVRPQDKAGRGRKTTLESKAYSNSKNSCLPSPYFARLCWQVVTSWLWPVVLGYLMSLLVFPRGDTCLFCSASCHPMETVLSGVFHLALGHSSSPSFISPHPPLGYLFLVAASTPSPTPWCLGEGACLLLVFPN